MDDAMFIFNFEMTRFDINPNETIFTLAPRQFWKLFYKSKKPFLDFWRLD